MKVANVQRIEHWLTREEYCDILSFVYLHLYRSIYDESYPDGTAIETALPAYRSYIEAVHRCMCDAAQDTVLLASRTPLSRSSRRLLTFVGNFEDDLDLE